jgi:hypothetical protein
MCATCWLLSGELPETKLWREPSEYPTMWFDEARPALNTLYSLLVGYSVFVGSDARRAPKIKPREIQRTTTVSITFPLLA